MAVRPQLFGLALCAGGGGLELGLSLALGDSYQCVCYVEREAHAAATLVKRMEGGSLDNAPVWDDLESFSGDEWRGVVDFVSAGFPCQPFSVAGKRKGAEDKRNLWPAVKRIIGEIRPSLVFLENVPGVLPYYFHVILSDLQGMEYEVTEGLFTAAEVGASHRRERFFILAYSTIDIRRASRDGGRESSNGESDRDVADTDSTGLERRRDGRSERADEFAARSSGTAVGFFPPGPDNRDAWARVLAEVPSLEPAVCRVADGMAHRTERLRLLGNGVVPIQAAFSFRALAIRAGLIKP